MFIFLFFDNDGAGFSVTGFTTRQAAWSWYENSTGDTRPAPRPGQDRRDLLNSGTDTLKINPAIHPGCAPKMDIIKRMKTKKAATDAAKFEAELKDADLSVEHVSRGEPLKEFPLSLESPIAGPKQEVENVIPRAAHTRMASRDATVGFCPLDVPAMEKMNSEDTPPDVARAEVKKWIISDAIKKPPVSVAARREQDERDGQPHTLNRRKSIIQRMRAKRTEREGWSTHVEDTLAEVEGVETCKLSVLEAPPHQCDRKDGIGFCPLDVAEMERTVGLSGDAKDKLMAQWLTAHRDFHPPIDATNEGAISQEMWNAAHASQPIVMYCRACVAPITMFIPREG
jgi:hypothetical protein